ncbi:MAG: stage III sporulation protein AB [bacterium]
MTALRFLGAGLLMAGALGYGAMELMALRRRVRLLGAWAAALELMRGELVTRLPPMAALLEDMARETREPLRGFFRRTRRGMEKLGELRFSEIWESALTESKLPLTEEETASLRELGASLGRFDLQLQQGALLRTAARFEDYRREAEERLRREGKVHLLFPVAAAVAVVVILL